MSTTSTITPTNETPKQPQQRQTAKDIIAVNVKSLIEQLEAGHSDALTAYLDAMSRFNNYSFGNILEIARQRPDATRVAGLYAWNQIGRKVMKGQKGHAHGIKVFGSTIMPDGGSPFHNPAGEAMRVAINAWIRAGGAFDGWFDFDKAVRNASNPETLAGPYDSPDHTHPVDAGYQAIAACIDLSVFH